MQLEFSPLQDRWTGFYANYGVVPETEPNTEGWANFNCVLPTHPKKDRKKHAAINIYSGSYRCWNEECTSAYISRVNKYSSSQILTPREFLMLTQGYDYSTAQAVVESYRIDLIPTTFSHNDEIFTKKFIPPQEDLRILVEQAQKALRPDLEIVGEYCSSRMLRYETLKEAGCGYIPYDSVSGQEECIILPYSLNGQVVGVRGRTIDGRKGGIKNSYYCLYNLDNMDRSESKTCVIVEGETDTLFLRQTLKDAGLDIPVFGTPGVKFPREWKRHLQGYTRIIGVPQADEAARQFIETLKGEVADRLEIVQLPWKPRQHGKDIVDYVWANQETGKEEIIHLLGITEDDYKPKKRVLSGNDFAIEAQKEVPWLIPGLLERSTKALFVGEPKTFKTWIALQLAKAITVGSPFMGVEEWVAPTLGKVLIVEEEGALYRMSQRIVTIFSDTGIPPTLEMIHRKAVRLDDLDSLLQLKQDVLNSKPDLLILDPYASLHYQDENTVQGTMLVISAINQLLKVHPEMAIVIIHHTPKGKMGARGSGALYGAIDLQIMISRVESAENTVKFSITGRDFIDEVSNKFEFEFRPELGCHVPKAGFEIAQNTTRKLKIADIKAQDIYKVLQSNKTPLTAEDIRSMFNLSNYTCRAALKILLDQGLIEQAGGGRRAGPLTYILKQKEVNEDVEHSESS